MTTMLITIDDELSESQPVITFEQTETCRHLAVYCDTRHSEVTCQQCGEKLNPVWILQTMSLEESMRRKRMEALQDACQKAEKKNRCKCEHCGKMTRISK